MYDATPVLTEIKGKWYHYDETLTTLYGPFETELEASHGCNLYAEWLDFGDKMPRAEELKELYKSGVKAHDEWRTL